MGLIPGGASLVAQMVKNLPAMQETHVLSLGGEGLLEKDWPPTLVFLPGELHGLKNLVGYSPWGLKESDMTEQFPLPYIIYGSSLVVQMVKNLPANAGDTGDTGSIPESGRSSGGGNGNPLQDSCLENSMARGAWWVTVHGVAKSGTRLSD